ncbi:MAG TPA: hypothetical protein VGT02_11045, partial [Methylomirabilota bacterium]|nr:hypothetical protein [Methylomirabilota bacterium]
PTPLLDNRNEVQVMRSRLADKTADETLTMAVNPKNVPHPRTNDFAALSAYQHARALFDTLWGVGLSPKDYFRFARLPLLVRHRATILKPRPGRGKTGRTVNAQVDYDPPGNNLIGGGLGGAVNPQPLQVRFAFADLRWSRTRAKPLGIATDERWSWHEFAHVLLAASTGSLELHFAHSPGDALAAIMGDWESALATPWSGMTWDRGLTFPWVYLHRRHDRSVFHGWSWNGRYHRQNRLPPVGDNARHKGYQSEQILSTSLFRVYRALGGDSADAARRQIAARYSAYLIVQAINLLGPAIVMPGETPKQFMQALVAADVGTPHKTSGLLKDRVGGWAHKVVRWAFHQQGLHEEGDPAAVIDAPGPPPDVDIFIDNRRPAESGARQPGVYTPVPLDWAAGQPSPWHAADAALAVGNQVRVWVGNRGPQGANNVKVRVWRIKWTKPGNPPPPKWDPAKWTQLPLAGGGADTAPVPGGAGAGGAPLVQFGPFTNTPPSSGRYLILAEATCPQDASNADSVLTSLPCAAGPTPIVDLVAGDNNLGLRLYEVV